MSTSSFLVVLEKKMDRARKMIDKVDDPAAFKAMDALFGVFEAMLGDATPTVVVMESDGKSEAKPKQQVKTKPDGQTAGERIANHGMYL